MNKDNEAEKLTIEERKIIHILLKHLMDMKNEIAYLKNKAALNNDDKDLPENRTGSNKLIGGLPEIISGGKKANGGLTETMQGGNEANGGLAETMQGGYKAKGGLAETMQGGNKADGGLAETMQGGNKADGGLAETMQGGNKADGGLEETMQGGNTVFADLPIININANGGALLYSVFEKALLNALDDYIKNGSGQNTLYSFYADFEDAVKEQNSAATKSNEAISNARLEDTHSLPLKIISDHYNSAILCRVLRKHLPRKANYSLGHTITTEILFLYNAGKATSSELRGFSGLSADGFEKHLTKLIRYDLIKKQPPSNYVLTDKSNHLLLELFGIPKTVI